MLQQVQARLARSGVAAQTPEPVTELLVTVFQELRTGRTQERVALPRPKAMMSTAEAVNVAHAAALEAMFLSDGRLTGAHLARQITTARPAPGTCVRRWRSCASARSMGASRPVQAPQASPA